jgi:hypothetical protein
MLQGHVCSLSGKETARMAVSPHVDRLRCDNRCASAHRPPMNTSTASILLVLNRTRNSFSMYSIGFQGCSTSRSKPGLTQAAPTCPE